METNDLIKSMEEDMHRLQKEFNDNEVYMQTIVEESKKLQENYNQAMIKREQLRGQYTGIFNLYNKMKGPKEDNSESSEQEKVVPISIGTSKTSKTTKSTKTSKSDTLTEEEKDKLKNINTKSSTKSNDIPEYLQEEYDKLNK